MRTQLFDHNRTAYKKVMKAFDTADRTCVVHPTGTGKSFLIAAVSESFKKVLILGPNTFVLDQVHGVLAWRDKPSRERDVNALTAKNGVRDGGVEYMTYTLLMYKEEVPTGYDLICLDEFHRAGAPEWGDAVDRLLEVNPQAKVLGTTATPIRFLDDNRDMADELFEGNIASYMTLKDAWDRDILATPRFVTGLFEFDKVTADIEDRISKSHRIDWKEKKQRLTRVNNLRLDWERSQGMPQIIRKHIDKDARRIIVFCGNVEKMKDMEQTVCGWFQKAGIKVASVYQMHAYMPDSELKSAMDGFESDDFGEGGVKLMLSVNMLNEGVHIPRVNAVILLRTTSSKIIYLQQIGRCLTAEKKDKPIILDMVDNITTTNIVHDIKEGFDWYEHQKPVDDEEHEPREPKDFVVYDYTLGIRQAIEKLVPHDWKNRTFEDRIAQLKAFCEKYGRMPLAIDDKAEYNNYHLLRQKYGDRQEIKDLRNEYGMVKDFEYRLARLQRFIAEHDRLPIAKKEKEEYTNFFTLRNRNELKPDERMQAILDKYIRKIPTDDEVLQQFLDFVEKNGRLPSGNYGSPKEETTLRRYVRTRLMDNPQVQEAFEKYKKITILPFDERFKQFKAFVEKHDRLPKSEGEKDEYNNYGRLRKMNEKENNAELNEILARYACHYTDEQIKQRVLDFYEQNGRLPIKSKDNYESALYKLMRDHRDTIYTDPDIAPLLKTRRKQLTLDERIKILTEYTDEHGQRPDPSDTYMYNMWIRTVGRQNTEKDPRVKDLYMKYGGMPSLRMKNYIAPLADYIHKYHKLPSTTDSKEEYHLYAILVNLRKNHVDHPDVKPLLDEIAALPTKEERRIARNDENTRQRIAAFVDKHGRLPKQKSKDRDEADLARQWAARRDRLCKDDPQMQAILDQYDKRPMRFEERYALVRDWAADQGRLPRQSDGEIFQAYETLRRSYYNIPEVKDLLSKYGRRPALPKMDIDRRLDQIEAFADEHDRLPTTAHSDEIQLARRWQNIKRRYGYLDRVVVLMERFPIQNRK